MKITERQNSILQKIVEEYIKSAKPVASQLVAKLDNFGISPATIRIEMQKLSDLGFLYQPHTSAGRIPTDKGYRLLVDELLEKGFSELDEDLFGLKGWQEFEDDLMLIREVTKILAKNSSSLALGYILDKNFLWKEGWLEVLREPEFSETEFTLQFVKTIDYFEKNIAKIFKDLPSEIQIYIGRENFFPKTSGFSTIISRCKLPENKEGVFAILGPKRMSYQKNINLINSVVKLLENY